jgi:hypothetical protein
MTQSRTLKAAQEHLPLSKLTLAADTSKNASSLSAGSEPSLNPAVQVQKGVISSLRTHLSDQFGQWELQARVTAKRFEETIPSG